MDAKRLYDEDFMLWTEQQAHALRQLEGSNTLDILHLAEEIEDLGKRDLREVESLIEQIFWHGLKLVADPEDVAARHWAGELTGFQSQLRRAFTPSMRRELNLDEVWADAMRRFHAARGESLSDFTALGMLANPPASIDELIAPSFDAGRFATVLAERLQVRTDSA